MEQTSTSHRDNFLLCFTKVRNDLILSQSIDTIQQHRSIPGVINDVISGDPTLSSSLRTPIVSIIFHLCRILAAHSKQHVESLKGWRWGTKTLHHCIGFSRVHSPQVTLLYDLGISPTQCQNSLQNEYFSLIRTQMLVLRNSCVDTNEILPFIVPQMMSLVENEGVLECTHLIQQLVTFTHGCSAKHHLLPRFLTVVSKSTAFPDDIPTNILSLIFSYSLPLYHQYIFRCISQFLTTETPANHASFITIISNNIDLFLEAKSMIQRVFFEHPSPMMSFVSSFFVQLIQHIQTEPTSLTLKDVFPSQFLSLALSLVSSTPKNQNNIITHWNLLRRNSSSEETKKLYYTLLQCSSFLSQEPLFEPILTWLHDPN